MFLYETIIPDSESINNLIYVVIVTIFAIIVPHMAAFCKAEEGGDTVESLTDDNAADVVIGGAIMLIINVSVY